MSRKNKEKKPVRKSTKYLWLTFWIMVIAPIAYLGNMVYRSELPQVVIPFEKIVKPKQIQEKNHMSLPIQEAELVKKHESFDPTKESQVVLLDSVMGNQGMNPIQTTLYSLRVESNKETLTYRIFYNGDFFIEAVFDYKDAVYTYVSGNILENPKEKGNLFGDVFDGEYTDFVSQTGGHVKGFEVSYVEINPFKTHYQFKEKSYTYDRISRKVSE